MDSLIDWLFEIADSTIRYRLAREFMEFSEREIKPLQTKLMNNPTVAKWVGNLSETLSYQMLHGSFDTNFENFMGRLSTLGLHKGTVILDSHAKNYLCWLSET